MRLIDRKRTNKLVDRSKRDYTTEIKYAYTKTSYSLITFLSLMSENDIDYFWFENTSK